MLRLGGPAIHPTILMPLLVMALAFTLLFVTLHLAAMRNEILRRRVRTLMLMQAQTRAGRLRRRHESRPARRLHRRRLRAWRLSSCCALIAWVVLDHRAQKRALGELEAQRRDAPLAQRTPRAPA